LSYGVPREAVGRFHRNRLERLFLRLGGRCKRDEERSDRHFGKVLPDYDYRCVRAHRRSYEAVVQPRSDRSDRATASVHFSRRRSKDALLTVFSISIETTFLIEFKPFPGV